MNVSGLLTSAGINIAICTVLYLLYSVLRKQPGNVRVYFGQRLAQRQSEVDDPSLFERLVPSASWIIKAWQTTEEELFAVGGLDAAVFSRVVNFSIRILSVAAVICIFLVLPVNYFGHAMHHQEIGLESLKVFTIGNVEHRSRWLWVHCLALYIISFCACALLYMESKGLTNMRLAYITGTPHNLSRFTVLVRAIPWSGKSYSDSVTKFFTDYYASSYLSHQIVNLPGRKLVNDAEKMYNTLKAPQMSKHCGSSIVRCGLCGVTGKSIRNPSEKSAVAEEKHDLADDFKKLECPSALVFFRTRYAALVAAQTLEYANPMLWVSEMAPEPEDVLWANLCVPYRLLWVRKLGILIAFIAFLVFFLLPVSFVQGLVHLEKLEKKFSYLRKLRGKRNFIFDMVTGYLPSAMLTLFLFCVPPIMIVSSAIEGPVARSHRKKSACLKVLYFIVWNVFFANILSGSVLERFDKITSLKDIPVQLANGVPSMAVFFMTYILTSGWTSLALELMQPFVLLLHWLDKGLFKGKNVLSCESQTFPYHTELPRALLFGLLGFTSAVTAPLMLPFLLVYFLMAYLIYRNQFINVYVTKYDTGGLYWPIAHSAIIFSLMLTQVILLGVFGLKKSAVASGFTIPLVVCTFLFHLYCRQRFLPVFERNFSQVIMEMDKKDELSGKLEEYHDQLQSGAYCQFKTISKSSSTSGKMEDCENGKLDSTLVPQVKHLDSGVHDRLQDPEGSKPAKQSNLSPNRFQYGRTNAEIEESKAAAQ